jgi:putative flippase GtrA
VLDILRRYRGFLVYLIGGVLSAAIDVGLMQLLIACGTPQLLAVTVGFVAGFLFNYTFHARVTFSHASRSAFVRYILLVAANYLLTMLIVMLAIRLAGSALAGKLVALPLVAANGYLLGKRWVFKPETAA